MTSWISIGLEGDSWKIEDIETWERGTWTHQWKWLQCLKLCIVYQYLPQNVLNGINTELPSSQSNLKV